MNAQNYAQAWKFLKEQTANVSDPLLRNAMMAEFRKRALNEWGFDPETGDLPKIDDVKKDDWEEEFMEDMAVAEKFNIDTREDKREETEKETRTRMRQMICNGETLDDIPVDIRTPHIEKLFLEEMINYAEELIKCADDLTRPMEI
jgi:hypothetical protein